ncbi:putative hydrolase [Bacillus sp. TS-2]|nr:putative hydrolase [Bacillus sp. TS-2]
MRIPKVVGIISWLLTCLYFVIEPLFIWTSTVPYSYLNQAMSDLGVTACGENTYPSVSFEICSPYAEWMNILFIINGITFIIGVLYLAQYLEINWRNTLATLFILLIGIGNIFSGIYPANIDLFWHSIFVVIGMITIFPGMWMYGKSLARGKYWTYFCCVTLFVVLLLILLGIFIYMPLGLLQRLFYFILFIWGFILSIKLSKA